MPIVGDAHNFNQKVEQINETTLIKPRELFFEKLFLSEEFGYRSFIDNLFLQKGLISPFNLAPIIHFGQNQQVELLKLDKLEKKALVDFLNDELNLKAFGALFGFVFWYGITDLHKENMFLGTKNNKLIFFPLDIECLFSSTSKISQTLLLPSTELPKEKCGFWALLDHVKEITEERKILFLKSFIDSVNLLNFHRHEIITRLLKIIAEQELQPKIRVILKNTKKYQEKINQPNSTDIFFAEELVQLERSDIPYFFKFINSDKLYYFNTKSSYQEAHIDLKKINIPTPMTFASSQQAPLKTESTILAISELIEMFNLEQDGHYLNRVVLKYERNKKILFNIRDNRIEYQYA